MIVPLATVTGRAGSCFPPSKEANNHKHFVSFFEKNLIGNHKCRCHFEMLSQLWQDALHDGHLCFPNYGKMLCMKDLYANIALPF